jgi:hypothetical protein
LKTIGEGLSNKKRFNFKGVEKHCVNKCIVHAKELYEHNEMTSNSWNSNFMS